MKIKQINSNHDFFNITDHLTNLSNQDKWKFIQMANDKMTEQMNSEGNISEKKPPLLLADVLIKNGIKKPYSDIVNAIKVDKQRLGIDAFSRLYKDLDDKLISQGIKGIDGAVDSMSYKKEKSQTYINSLADNMFNKFKSNPDKTYLFTTPLADALKTVKLSVQVKHLPKNICAFFKFPDLYYYDIETNLKNYIDGILVETRETINNGLAVSMIVFSKNYFAGIADSNVNYFPEENMDKLVYDSIKSNRHNSNENDSNMGIIFENSNENCIFMVYAGLIYLSSQKDEINDQFIKGKYPLLPKKNTSCSYHILGAGVTNVRKTTSNEWEVSAHPRWQPCGPGFSQTRLIFIQNYSKKFHPIYIEDVDALENDEDKPLYNRWEMNDRSLFIPKLKNSLMELGVEYQLIEEYQVRKESFHKIDYVLKIPSKGIIIGLEYKSSKATWSRMKIEDQRNYYHFYLERRYLGASIFPRSKSSYGIVETFLVSDNGRYGIDEDSIIAKIKELYLSNEIE